MLNKEYAVQQRLIQLEQVYLFSKDNYVNNKTTKSNTAIPVVNAEVQRSDGSHTTSGLARIEATRIALKKQLLDDEITSKARVDRLAIVIHAFYDDLLIEIMQFLQQVDNVAFKLYVTSPNECTAQAILAESGFDFYLEKTNNHGRDVLPFLQIMKQVKSDGYGLIIKVHTKKSLHRDDGHIWRQDLYNQLLKKTAIEQGLKRLQTEPKLGLLVPEGHLLPVTLHLGNNMHHLLSLSHRQGVLARELLELKFAAGTMFMAKVSALEPLLSLNLNGDDFEREEGQVDGTMAHAIERAIAVSAFALGFEVSSMSTNA